MLLCVTFRRRRRVALVDCVDRLTYPTCVASRFLNTFMLIKFGIRNFHLLVYVHICTGIHTHIICVVRRSMLNVCRKTAAATWLTEHQAGRRRPTWRSMFFLLVRRNRLFEETHKTPHKHENQDCGTQFELVLLFRFESAWATKQGWKVVKLFTK